MKRRIRRVLALLLCLSMTLTMNAGVLANEISGNEAEAVQPVQETETGEKTDEEHTEKTATEQPSADNVNKESAENEEAKTEEESSSGAENSKDDEASANEVSFNETAEASENGTAAEENPGSTEVACNAPDGWIVTGSSAEVAEWYQTEENTYNVYFKQSGIIGYYPTDQSSSTSAKVTVISRNSAEEINVIVQGGDYGQGTSGTVPLSHFYM